MTYRNGPVGALLDIYEMEIIDLSETIRSNFETIDGEMEGGEWNMKRIMTHVIHAGFGYTLGIRNQWGGNELKHKKDVKITSVIQTLELLKEIFEYMEISLSDKVDFDEKYFKEPLTSRWGQSYDLEQMVEHAIVHIQRHHRQIKRYFLS